MDPHQGSEFILIRIRNATLITEGKQLTRTNLFPGLLRAVCNIVWNQVLRSWPGSEPWEQNRIRPSRNTGSRLDLISSLRFFCRCWYIYIVDISIRYFIHCLITIKREARSDIFLKSWSEFGSPILGARIHIIFKICNCRFGFFFLLFFQTASIAAMESCMSLFFFTTKEKENELPRNPSPLIVWSRQSAELLHKGNFQCIVCVSVWERECVCV